LARRILSGWFVTTAEIYGWFTEGVDTAGLKEARRCWTN
jgi:hypothetical protein